MVAAKAAPLGDGSASPVELEGDVASSGSDASAAAPGQTPSSDELQDIVVTAQRRSERLQDTTVSVTAITPQIAIDLGLQTLDDLEMVTPGTSFKNSLSFAQLYIRGIGNSFITPGLESPIAVYQDGVYVPQSFGANKALVDPGISQILRGPQGTLYGRNAVGGVVLLSSADQTKLMEAGGSIEYGNLNTYQFDGFLNLPVSDTISVRFAGRTSSNDGYIHNVAQGNRLVGGETDNVARAKIK